MQGGVESKALVGPSKNVRHEDEVSGGRDGKELGQALDDTENNTLGVVHPTTSSPPSTPITLPVIQYASGWVRATTARATSSVSVSRPLGFRWRATAIKISWPGILARAAVSVTPARMALAVMPREASSMAS